MEPDEPGTSAVAIDIMPLASPKGKEKYCELCQREAYLECAKCQVTFYCNADHQQADWVGVHERICQMLVPIRAVKDMYDPAVRKKNQLRKAHLIKICKLVAQSKLSEGKHEEALPAAHCCLQTSIDLYGPNTIQLVPAYILLAEANMGLGNLTVVAELLSQAEWAVLKNPELGASVQQQLHRSLGQYYTSAGNLENALFHFANDIYFACVEYGLDSSATTKGYFLIADVFARQGKTLIVHSLYSEVAERWHKHLTSLLETHQKHADSSVSFYEKSQRVEMEEMLRVMLEFEQTQSRRDVSQIALIAYNLAMLWFINGDLHKAQDFGSTALQASLQIPRHKLTEPIQELLQQVESLQTEPRPGSASSTLH
ncbi:zinc finger MYND domain-containing protein 12 isoform X2 [Poeciliopsis prolifica]|uniref:zinc finger MYND domain-containing protein 12 isoform X2 n=1 Tax=Poeciliopsis prolifica TaxID=188132 RepID=UPI00241300FE|nr:zinc finger MYND domain-containing protein 12 isoform X2 [Poeciliopsis prolifica]